MRKKKKNPLRRTLIVVTSILLALVAAVALARAIFYYIDDMMPAFRQDGVVLVHPGSSLQDVLDDIDENLQPKDSTSVRRVLKDELEGRKLCPGMYTFNTGHTARFMARSLTRGWQQPTMVVIDGRLRSKKDIADRLAMYMMAGSDDFLRTMNDSLLLDKYGFRPSQIFAMVIPDSYQMYWSATPEEVIARLKKEYNDYWNEERRAAAAEQGLTPYQVSVLASIVNEETNIKSDLPKVASVYLTRMRKGWKLQACPTICYIYNYQLTRVLYRHLKTDSPYNTYKYEGLPPTPICVPSKASIEAVLHPDETPYLYFCADSSLNGASHFSTSYFEHVKNAALYKKALEKQSKQDSE